ncbi:MAG: DNA-3-methyladenine glycosylase I [Rhizomicrobium sp.]
MNSEIRRCPWPGTDPLYVSYHDEEWGVPEFDSRALYEKLILDGFQAGLSWITILRKRENLRRAFEGFDPHQVARYSERQITRLLRDESIIRSRGKIESAITGARKWLDIMEKDDGGFSQFIWKHVEGRPRINRYRSRDEIPAKTQMSEALAKDLKQQGFSYCGPVIVYAFAQATGMVNDHIVSCHRHGALAVLAAELR